MLKALACALLAALLLWCWERRADRRWRRLP